MSDYTIAVAWSGKDALADSDSAKIISGDDFNTEFTAVRTALNSKANIASPTFTGTPAAPTASAGTNTTQIATTAFLTSKTDFTENTYKDGDDWKYTATGEAFKIAMADGACTLSSAPSGSEDATITWVEGLKIHTTGDYGSKVTLDGASAAAKLNITYDAWLECDGINLYDTDDHTGGGAYELAAIKFYRDGSVVGSIKTTDTSTSFNTSSDYRLKENVAPMSGAIDRLKELKPSRFNFKSDPSKTLDGFLAHEVSDYVPEAITGEKDDMVVVTKYTADDIETQGENPTKELGDPKTYSETEIEPQGIDQSKIVPLLVGALQEAIARIETLESQ